MGNNNNGKESWERDTLRMRPVRPEAVNNNSLQQPETSAPRGRSSTKAVHYTEDDGNGKAKIVIGVIAAIIVILSLILMYLDMSAKNSGDEKINDTPAYEDTIEYDIDVSEPDNSDSVTEEAAAEEEKDTEEEQKTQEESTQSSETEPPEAEEEDNPESSETDNGDTSTTLPSEPEQTPVPEGGEEPAAANPSSETTTTNTQPEEVQ